MNGLHRFSIRHPVMVITIAALVLLAVAPGMLRLRLRTDGHALVPEASPAVRIDRAVRLEFGVRDPLVVLVRPRDRDGIFNPRTLHLVADLSAALARIPGLDRNAVRSLATESSDHFRPGTLERRLLLEPLPETRERIEELRSDLAAFGLYDGTLVAFGGEATAILVGTPPDADRTALVSEVSKVVARADTVGHEVHVIGAPVAEALLGTHILQDLGISGRLFGRPAESETPGLGLASRARLAIARHVGLLPLSVAVMALVFLLSFRSVTATLLPLSEAAACLMFVFGLMGWSGVPVYLTMAVLPVILVSMGLADEIHIFSCFAQRRAARPDEPVAESVRAALDEMSLPVVATSATTAIGFLSFAISPLTPVRMFGLFTAAGIVFCMLWTLTVIPALLVLLAPRTLHAPGVAAAPTWSGAPGANAWRTFARGVSRRPAFALVLAAIGLALSPLGIRRLAVQDSWIAGFARDSDFYRATQDFNRRFFGTHRLLLAIDTGALDLRGALPAADLGFQEIFLPRGIVPEPTTLTGCSLAVVRRVARPSHFGIPSPISWSSTIDSATARDGRIVVTTPLYAGSARFMLAPAPGETLDYLIQSQRLVLPAVLRQLDDLERFIRSQRRYTVGGVIGPPDHVLTAEFIASDRMAGAREIPNDMDQVRWLWNAIGTVQGPERLSEVVDSKLRRGLIVVFMKNANFADTGRLMAALRDYERSHLAPEHIRIEFAGDVAVSQALIAAIVDSQVRSLLASLLGILAVTALIFRSLRWGAICMVPAALATAATFAVMGWAGLPLGVATSMFASMVLGIGVDFAIHLVQRYRLERARGVAGEEAIAEALVATGPAIIINGLAVALGFGILVLSRVPANAQLGAITVVSLLACLAATLLVIPALLRVAGRR